MQPSRFDLGRTHLRPPPNLLDHLDSSFGKGSGAPWWGKALLVALVVAVLGGGAVSVSLATRVERALSAITTNTHEGFLSQLRGFTNPPEKPLRGEANDRINVVILGVGGEGHAGSQLADTIIIASYQPSTGRAGLFSIPRDLVVEIPGYGYRKINHVNSFGEDQGPPGNGAEFTRTVLEKMLAAPLQYSVRVDFDGFSSLIDDVGGVQIDVERSFVDYEFPTDDFGYQTVRFQAGTQRMSGATALTYARSRHGNNAEGSDFARSKRQQKVLIALKERVLSVGTLLNPARIADVLTTLGEHVRTNFEPWEMMKFTRLGRDIDTTQIVTRVLDTSPDGLLVNSVGLDGAYILEPRAKNYSEIQGAFRNLLEASTEETATVELQNGTLIAGLAATTASRIATERVEVVRVRNAKNRTTATTVIYDLTGGKKPEALAAMKAALGAEVVTFLPDAGANIRSLNINDIGSSLTNGETLRLLQADETLLGTDFVIVLGSDQLPVR